MEADPRILKPIKIKKKNKCCANCKHYRQFYCGKAGQSVQIPAKILANGCKKYKKNKHIYF